VDAARRTLILREMGLAPQWRLRGSGQGPEPAAAGEALPTQSVAAGGMEMRAAPLADERTARIMGLDWPELRQEVSGCESCGLCRTRTHTVFGVGDEQADWLLVGEAPGAEEDARGEPFVGQAGRLLDSMLASIGLQRGSKVFIANVLKCRPPGNRNPDAQEVAQCGPFLHRQIELLQPKLIVAMGRFAAQTLLDTDATIGSLRGRLHRYRGLPLIVTYHPAYLLRSLPEKAKAWEDLCLARRTMAGL
jgi:uracil-DNA glycosylase